MSEWVDYSNIPHRDGFAQEELPDHLLDVVVTNTRLSSAETLTHLTRLETLVARSNQLRDVTPLAALTTLRSLDLYENAVEDLSPLYNSLPLLTFNAIRGFSSPITGFPALTELYLVNNKLRSCDGVEEITTLRVLELGANRLRSISVSLHPLAPSLEQLWLGRNKITRIENLEPLVNLRNLSLQANRITVIEGVATLTNLSELSLSENGIQRIEGLGTLKQLTLLDLASNMIETLDGLEELESLEELWINSNKISEVSELDKLRSLAQLKTIYLEHNPLAAHVQYRNVVIAALPTITQLDANVVRRSQNPLLSG